MMLKHKSTFLKKNIIVKGHQEHLIYTKNVLEYITDEMVKDNVESLLKYNYEIINSCNVHDEVKIISKKYEKTNLIIYGDTYLTCLIYNIIKRHHSSVKQVVLKDEKFYEVTNNKKETNISKNSVILILSFNNFYTIKEKLKCVNIRSNKIIRFWDIINDDSKTSYFKNLSLNLQYCISKSQYEDESYFIVPPNKVFAFKNIFDNNKIRSKNTIEYDFLFCMYLNDNCYKYF